MIFHCALVFRSPANARFAHAISLLTHHVLNLSPPFCPLRFFNAFLVFRNKAFLLDFTLTRLPEPATLGLPIVRTNAARVLVKK